jgi:hypothetical protein
MPENSRDFHLTTITVSSNKKSENDSRCVHISSRRAGVPFSLKKDKKRLIQTK